MKSLARGLVVLSVVLVSAPLQAQSLVLYDDFNIPLINPGKWNSFGFGLHVNDSARLIRNNQLWLVNVAYGDQTSDAGGTFQTNGLTFANPAAITTIRSTITVIGTAASACGTNPGTVTAAEVSIQGTFFNAGTVIPSSTRDDVYAALYLAHSPGDPTNGLRVFSSVWRCLDEFCNANTSLGGGDLGTATTGQAVTLLVQWDQPNKQFVFRQGANPPVVVPYSVPDGFSPGAPNKFLEAIYFIPNCTSAPRPAAAMSVLLDNVFVNP